MREIRKDFCRFTEKLSVLPGIFLQNIAVKLGGGVEIAIDRAVVAEKEKGAFADAEGDLLPSEERKGASHPDLPDGGEGGFFMRKAQNAQGVADGEQGSGLAVVFTDRADALIFAIRRQAVLIKTELGIATECTDHVWVGSAEALFCGGTMQRRLLSL